VDGFKKPPKGAKVFIRQFFLYSFLFISQLSFKGAFHAIFPLFLGFKVKNISVSMALSLW